MSSETDTETEKEAETEDSKLTISSHVVVQLGRELVTDSEQAVLELVKNSYDACANSCEVNIEGEWSKDEFEADLLAKLEHLKILDKKEELYGKIRVVDDGVGLNAEEVKKSWLKISSSIKRAPEGEVKKETPCGRVPVGDKGLGRLATMKLGRLIRLDTKKRGEKDKQIVWFSWESFSEGTTLDDIPVYHYQVEDLENQDFSGTTIEIIGLYEPEKWGSKEFVSDQLRADLSKFVSPFLEKDKGFEIRVICGGTEYDLSHLREDVLKLSAYECSWRWCDQRLERESIVRGGMFLGDGKGKAKELYDKFIANKEKRDKFVDWLIASKKLAPFNLERRKFPELIKISSLSDFDVKSESAKNLQPAKDPGELSAKLYDFNYSPSLKDALSVSGVPVSRLQTIGVQIFRDGFLIRSEKDWLALSENQTSGGSYYGLRPRNTLGYFRISNSKNPGLIEKSDRESFVDNPAYRGFLSIARKFRDSENLLREILRREFREFVRIDLGSPEEELEGPDNIKGKVKKEFNQISSYVSKAAQELSEDKSIPRERKELYLEQFSKVKVNLKNYSDKYDHLIEEGESLNDRLIDAAAVGLTARSISHELHQYSRQIKQGADKIRAANKRIKNDDVKEGIVSISGALRELTKMVAALDPMLPGSRSLKEAIDTQKYIEGYVENRKSHASAKGVLIEVSHHFDKSPLIRFSTSRFSQILENLYQNSVYWSAKTRSQSQPKPKITVTILDDGFIWEDTGPGINPLYEESIFDPYVTDKPHGEGQGLGLHIISVFLRSEGCCIFLMEDRNSLRRKYRFKVDLSGAIYSEAQKELI